MKIDVTRAHAEEILSQLSDLRAIQRDQHNNTVEWDRTALGQLFSMLNVELNKRSHTSVARSAAVANRQKVKSRFTR